MIEDPNNNEDQEKKSFFDFAKESSGSEQWPPVNSPFDDSEDNEDDEWIEESTASSPVEEESTSLNEDPGDSDFPWEITNSPEETVLEEAPQNPFPWEASNNKEEDSDVDLLFASSFADGNQKKDPLPNLSSEGMSFLRPKLPPQEEPKKESLSEELDEAAEEDALETTSFFNEITNTDSSTADSADSLEDPNSPFPELDFENDANDNTAAEEFAFNPENIVIEEDQFSEDEAKALSTEDIAKAKNPYRAFAAENYIEEQVEFEEEAEAPFQLNRQAIVLITLFLLVGGYFAYNAIFNKEYSATTKSRRKARRPEQKRLTLVEQELLPLWNVSNQKGQDWQADALLIKDSLANSGRTNPFAIPEEVIAYLKKELEDQIAREKPPEVFDKTAYRATLVGVLSSVGQTLALINLKTAVFEVVETADKAQIVKLATKEMQRAKDDTLEMLSGDYVGPWQLIELHDGRTDNTESRAVLERDGQQMVLRMGIPLDLGIYDDDGELDTYKNDHEFEETSGPGEYSDSDAGPAVVQSKGKEVSESDDEFFAD